MCPCGEENSWRTIHENSWLSQTFIYTPRLAAGPSNRHQGREGGQRLFKSKICVTTSKRTRKMGLSRRSTWSRKVLVLGVRPRELWPVGEPHQETLHCTVQEGYETKALAPERSSVTDYFSDTFWSNKGSIVEPSSSGISSSRGDCTLNWLRQHRRWPRPPSPSPTASAPDVCTRESEEINLICWGGSVICLNRWFGSKVRISLHTSVRNAAGGGAPISAIIDHSRINYHWI